MKSSVSLRCWSWTSRSKWLSLAPLQCSQVRRLHCVTPWTVRDQILEISAARLHILRLPTRVAFWPLAMEMLLTSCQWNILFCSLSWTDFFFSFISLCLFSADLFCGCVLFVFPGLVHVGDELREVNGNLITHKRPDEISQILVGKKKTHHHPKCRYFSIVRQRMVTVLFHFFSVAVTRLYHAENYSSCCRWRQAERKPGETLFPAEFLWWDDFKL